MSKWSVASSNVELSTVSQLLTVSQLSTVSQHCQKLVSCKYQASIRKTVADEATLSCMDNAEQMDMRSYKERCMTKVDMQDGAPPAWGHLAKALYRFVIVKLDLVSGGAIGHGHFHAVFHGNNVWKACSHCWLTDAQAARRKCATPFP